MHCKNSFSAVLFLASMAGAAAVPSHAYAQAETEAATETDAEAETSETTPDGEEVPVERPTEGPFIYALTRLATVLGSMHFLRELCADEDMAVWRVEMSELIKAQKPNGPDRRRLIASFNNGYRGYASTYRHCTPAARLAHNRYQLEGATLSRDIVTRYGN